jgi:hypothetical protein
MTTFYNFVVSHIRAPSFTPTLDGQQYTITITFNISAQRYYINCLTIDGQLLFSVPLVESTQPIEIETLTWDQTNQRVVAKTVAPHGFTIGRVMNLSIINAKPGTYNGSGFCSILSETEFVYPMIPNPGQPFFMGAVQYLISMTKGYFQSTLVYRNRRFEVSP